MTASSGPLRFTKGKLANIDLEPCTDEDLVKLSRSPSRTQLKRVSFYKGLLRGVTFQGITFAECNFAKVRFEKVTFSRCTFRTVDLTRTVFIDCFLSDCSFVDADLYYPEFQRTEVDPASFKKSFSSHEEWNKALLLFAELRRSLRELGESRLSRKADYFFRIWQRRRLYHRWKFKRIAGFGPWFRSLCLAALNGYGERPAYLAIWAFGVVTAAALVYWRFFPFAVSTTDPRFVDFWYYSFKVFFAQGLSAGFQSGALTFAQMAELVSGLVLVALLIGSVARKLSP